MSLQNPAQKMSKSDPNPNGFVSIIDTPDVIRKKLRKAVTDCDGIVKYDLPTKRAYPICWRYTQASPAKPCRKPRSILPVRITAR